MTLLFEPWVIIFDYWAGSPVDICRLLDHLRSLPRLGHPKCPKHWKQFTLAQAFQSQSYAACVFAVQRLCATDEEKTCPSSAKEHPDDRDKRSNDEPENLQKPERQDDVCDKIVSEALEQLAAFADFDERKKQAIVPLALVYRELRRAGRLDASSAILRQPKLLEIALRHERLHTARWLKDRLHVPFPESSPRFIRVFLSCLAEKKYGSVEFLLEWDREQRDSKLDSARVLILGQIGVQCMIDILKGDMWRRSYALMNVSKLAQPHRLLARLWRLFVTSDENGRSEQREDAVRDWCRASDQLTQLRSEFSRRMKPTTQAKTRDDTRNATKEIQEAVAYEAFRKHWYNTLARIDWESAYPDGRAYQPVTSWRNWKIAQTGSRYIYLLPELMGDKKRILSERHRTFWHIS